MKRAVALLLLLCAACGDSDAPGTIDEALEDAEPTAQSAPASQASATPAAPKGRFAPRNTCADLPGARDFQARLIEAVTLRDTDAVAAFASPDIKLNFGGGGGIDEFRKQLRAGGEPSLWQSLDQVLKLGCAGKGRDQLIIPWLFDQDLGRIDPFVAHLVLGEDVPILDAPRSSGEEIGQISWELVNVSRYDRSQPFQHISMPGNAVGYIATDKLRSVVDYRLLATRVDGQWKIMALVKGD